MLCRSVPVDWRSAEKFSMRVLAFLLSAPFIQVAALFLAILWMVRDQKDKVRPLLVMALIINLFYGILLSIFMGAEGGLMPWKYDAILWQLDAALGVPTQALAGALQGTWRGPLATTYQLMIPMMIGWFLVVRRSGRGGALVLAYAAELVTGPLLYAVVPACGPVYAFKADWLHAAAPTAELIRLLGMPNAFPSLHIGTAMVLLLFAPGRWWRTAAGVFFTATALATVATGEHYIIDLVPGVAFGCFAALAGVRRFRSALGLLGLTLSWALLVRLEYSWLIAHTVALRMLVTITLLTAVAVVARFCRPMAATERRAEPEAISAQGPEQPPPVHMATP
jgi:hypothetical protein